MERAAQIVKRLVEDDGDMVDPELKDALIDAAPSHEKFMRDVSAAFPDFEFDAIAGDIPDRLEHSFGFVVVAKNRVSPVPRDKIRAFCKRWLKTHGVSTGLPPRTYSFHADWARRFYVSP